jgi:DNA-directed RNA polymerase specialized sigma24 family protein
VQTNKIFLSALKPRKGDMTNIAVQGGWKEEEWKNGWMEGWKGGRIHSSFQSSNLPLFFPLSGWESQDSMSKLNSVSASDHIQALYRLLLIRTGRRIEAEQAVRDTLAKSPRNPDLKPAKADFAAFFRTALKEQPSASATQGTDLEGWPLALHQLPEPERSAITLFYLEIFSPRELSEILGVNIGELARIIGAARKSLEDRQTKSNIP